MHVTDPSENPGPTISLPDTDHDLFDFSSCKLLVAYGMSASLHESRVCHLSHEVPVGRLHGIVPTRMVWLSPTFVPLLLGSPAFLFQAKLLCLCGEGS
jgi:hypothetical protein